MPFPLKFLLYALLGGVMLFQPGPGASPSEKIGTAEYGFWQGNRALGALCRSVELSEREEGPVEDPLAAGKCHPCCLSMTLRAPLLPPASPGLPAPRMAIVFWPVRSPPERLRIASYHVPHQPRAPPILT